MSKIRLELGDPPIHRSGIRCNLAPGHARRNFLRLSYFPQASLLQWLVVSARGLQGRGYEHENPPAAFPRLIRRRLARRSRIGSGRCAEPSVPAPGPEVQPTESATGESSRPAPVQPAGPAEGEPTEPAEVQSAGSAEVQPAGSAKDQSTESAASESSTAPAACSTRVTPAACRPGTLSEVRRRETLVPRLQREYGAPRSRQNFSSFIRQCRRGTRVSLLLTHPRCISALPKASAEATMSAHEPPEHPDHHRDRGRSAHGRSKAGGDRLAWH